MKMVKTKPGFVLATAFLSGIAAVLSIISLSTEQWVVGEGRFTLEGGSDLPSEIQYGLFSGTYFRRILTPIYYEISITCLISENICAYLCQSSSETSEEQLKKIFAGEVVSFDPRCARVPRRNDVGEFIDYRYLRAGDQREYINAGLYISTVIFLCISAIFGVISAALSVWNTAANPVEVYLSIYGLYIYNSIACAGSIFTLILWGAQFGSILVNNVAILETIVGDMESTANLGYSYWLNLPSCLLYFTSVGVLFVRQYLISQEPEIKIHTTSGDQDVGDLMNF